MGDSGIRVQIVWSEADPALPIKTRGEQARRAAGVSEIHHVPGKHFYPEDQAPLLANLVAAHAGGEDIATATQRRRAEQGES